MGGLRTIKRGGSRYYVHPETGEKYPGVTSVIDNLPKPFLQFWAAKLTAETAADNIGVVVQMLLNGERKSAIDFMKNASRRFTAEAADNGTAVHELFERIARGDQLGRVHPELAPYVNHIREFTERFEPEYLHVEDAVWSDTHRYAGSFDAIVRIGDDVVMLDAKSTRSGVHDSVALQLAAYRHADHIVTQSGDAVPMPDITAAAVLHLRPEGWKLVPVRADEAVFDDFLTLRALFGWIADRSHTVIGIPLYDSQTTTGAQRRAAR